jgi:hypothetical protein
MNEFNIQIEPGTPARVDVSRAAKILGVNEHDIPTLVRARLLKPLGNPVQSACKYFATCELARLANSVDFLDRATRAISQHWKKKNMQRSRRKLDVAA